MRFSGNYWVRASLYSGTGLRAESFARCRVIRIAVYLDPKANRITGPKLKAEAIRDEVESLHRRLEIIRQYRRTFDCFKLGQQRGIEEAQAANVDPVSGRRDHLVELVFDDLAIRICEFNLNPTIPGLRAARSQSGVHWNAPDDSLLSARRSGLMAYSASRRAGEIFPAEDGTVPKIGHQLRFPAVQPRARRAKSLPQ